MVIDQFMSDDQDVFSNLLNAFYEIQKELTYETSLGTSPLTSSLCNDDENPMDFLLHVILNISDVDDTLLN